MAFDRIVEEKIRDAMAGGEFDNLTGAGKSLNLDEYFATPEDLRASYSLLKSARVLPMEVELLREIESLKSQASECAIDSERDNLLRRARERRMEYDLLMERYKRQKSARR